MNSQTNMNEADSFLLLPTSGESLDALESIKRDVEREIYEEQNRQVAKFGLRDQSNGIWNAILVEEVGEVSTALLRIRFNKENPKQLRKEIIQVAAVAKSWIENLDIQNLENINTLFHITGSRNGVTGEAYTQETTVIPDTDVLAPFPESMEKPVGFEDLRAKIWKYVKSDRDTVGAREKVKNILARFNVNTLSHLAPDDYGAFNRAFDALK